MMMKKHVPAVPALGGGIDLQIDAANTAD